MEEQVQQVMSLVDDLGDPKKMTREDFVEFCDELIASIETRKEAVEDEMDSDDGEDSDGEEEDDEEDEED